MKTIPPPLCICVIVLIAAVYLLSMRAEAQTYIIDSTFTDDAIIQPFGPNDTIYSLEISGSLVLDSDTSLIRVVVGNADSLEYMVFEYYPLISDSSIVSFISKSDETKYLDVFIPRYLKVYIVSSSLTIDSLASCGIYSDDLDSLQIDSKRTSDLEKILVVNENIAKNGWNWTAGENSLLELFYKDKSNFFTSEKYNLEGYDYYIDGVFCTPSSNYYSNNNSQFIKEFDWRNKHDANDPSAPFYYNSEIGWITGLKAQGGCGACVAFGTLASLEALANIYYNPSEAKIHLNLNLSEQELFCCIHGDCQVGALDSDALDYLDDHGAHNEECYYYNTSNINDDCCEPCPDGGELYKVFISDHDLLEGWWCQEVDSLKSWLIRRGPLVVSINSLKHTMCLVGYENEEGTNDIIWIFKDSNPDEGDFNKMKLDPNDLGGVRAIATPLTIVYLDGITPSPERNIWDKDNDGYYNWGISDKGTFDSPCDERMDWNDNKNRIGPVDENYFSQNVEPTIEVYLGDESDGRKIENHGFCHFFNEDLDENGSVTITIQNSGTAQLNFVGLNPVVELVDDDNCFLPNLEGFTNKICHVPSSNTTDFKIAFSCIGNEIKTAKYKIDILECDEDVLEDFEFTLVYFDCSIASGLWTITGQETISGILPETRNIVVESGGTLTVSGMLGIAPEGSIIVKPGGALIVDGGQIIQLCPGGWKGIDVWGDATLSQYPYWNQGFLKVFNDGCIENADIAVQLTKEGTDAHQSPYNGGIVRCYDADFKNNIIDVKFYSYNNFDPNTGAPKPNTSYFFNTRFINDKICDKSRHVDVQNVDGIRFNGCLFKNSVNRDDCNFGYNKGKGIYSINSGYYIKEHCYDQSVPCNNMELSRFENLEYGVYALNAGYNEFISIDTAIFYNTYRGVFMHSIDNPEIIRSQFIYDEDYDPASDNLDPYGADLEYCSYFTIEENDFKNSSDDTKTLGIQILNGGPYAHEVYNNSFEGLCTGISAVGINRDNSDGVGLCIKCNDFTECITDIYVTPEEDANGNPILPPGQTIGIGKDQGEPNEPGYSYAYLAAGNTFTDGNTNDHYINESPHCSPITYTHHDDESTTENIIPVPYSGSITIEEDEDAQYGKATSCPSNLSGGGGIDPTAEKTILVLELDTINAFSDTLNMMIDGGDTETLNMDVQTSFPNEAMEVRQQLLVESPYLSDTIMKTAISKENVLPNAMIRDILVANPQSAKTPDVVNYLNTRFNPMPDYMMDEIMQGLNVIGAKEIYHNKIAYHKSIRMNSLNKLEKFYRYDTIDALTAQDSLIALWYREPYLDSWYNLAFKYLKIADSSLLFSTIDSIPSQFELSLKEEIIHLQYDELFNLIWNIYNDTATIDSTEIQSLLNISENFNIPGNIALNLLINEGIVLYSEKVYLPDLLKEYEEIKHPSIYTYYETYMNVFPIPANNFFIVEYIVPEKYSNASIELVGLDGKHHQSISINSQHSQAVLSADGLSNGIYIINLKGDGQVLEVRKIIISK